MIFDKDFNVSLYRNVGGFLLAAQNKLSALGLFVTLQHQKSINDYG